MFHLWDIVWVLSGVFRGRGQSFQARGLSVLSVSRVKMMAMGNRWRGSGSSSKGEWVVFYFLIRVPLCIVFSNRSVFFETGVF